MPGVGGVLVGERQVGVGTVGGLDLAVGGEGVDVIGGPRGGQHGPHVAHRGPPAPARGARPPPPPAGPSWPAGPGATAPRPGRSWPWTPPRTPSPAPAGA